MSPEATTSIAFAGAGMIASVHLEAIQRIPELSVGAVASRSPERAASAAQRLGVPATTYDQLPAGTDAVMIATPPAHHEPLALRLMDAGVPVLVEKPLCTTLAAGDRLVAAAERGGRLAYAENLVHAPAVQEALEQAQLLVGIDHLELRALQPRPTWGDFLLPSWGGGVLFDLGAHPIALALLFAAPARPTEVLARLEGADDHEVDEHADVTLRFDSGAQAHLVVSWRNDDDVVWDAQVACPTGIVRLELLPEVRVEVSGTEVQLPALEDGVPASLQELGYLDQMRSFAADVATGGTPLLGAAFGQAVLDVTCAAYASAADGSWVSLPFTGPRDRTPHQLWRGA
ncbi:MAG: Gfo/Idh/MocA family oxidoreductase [Actinomycetota bacterium]|nr:Gfo/Idh/MocA family oxidoreductase [Actinomycetota bacterium]